MLIAGNEAIGLGAIASGVKFYSAYPMTPSTGIMNYIAGKEKECGIIVEQAEDETSAINMALGASFAGVRAMTGTSGGGFALMVEGISLAGMTETPVVIVLAQRPGPATGFPTRTEQGDLQFALYTAHGEFPRIIFAPGTIEECFFFTIKAFNLAEKYQIPVILLTEQDYGQNLQTVKRFNLSRVKIERGKLLSQEELFRIDDYKRYRFTPDGVSPRVIPSMKGGLHMVESNEHNERGYRDEDPENRIQMMEKRMRKLGSLRKDLIPPRIWGKRQAEIGIVGFGSTFGPIQEARERLQEQGVQTKYLQVRTIWPFPSREVEAFFSSCRKVFVVESNYSGQLHSLIRSQVKHLPELKSIRNYSSLAFRPLEVLKEIEKAL